MQRKRPLLALATLLACSVAAQAQLPGRALPPVRPPAADQPGPFPFPFPMPGSFDDLLQGRDFANRKPPTPEDLSIIRFLQDHGVPPSLFLIDPSDAGGQQVRVDLYDLQPSKPSAAGRELYRLLSGLDDKDVRKISKKKLYVLLSLIRQLVDEQAKPSAAAFPERAQALRKRLASVLALDIPEDKDFAGLGTDSEALTKALADRRDALDALLKQIAARPEGDPNREAAFQALARLSSELGTLALDPGGAPLVPRGLYDLVRSVPESALAARQWRTLFCSFPMGRSLWELRIDRLWRGALSGGGVNIAILDTGVDKTHPDLEGAVVEEVNLTNHRFTTDFRDASGELHRVGEPDNRGEHATHVASTVHAIAPEAKIVNLKVLDEEAQNLPDELKHDRTQVVTAIYDGLDWVLRHNRDVASGKAAGEPIHIVSMSLGLPGSNTMLGGSERDLLSRKVKELTDAGVIVIVATGNEGNDTARRPGLESTAITVGAADWFGRKAPFASNRSIVDPASQELYDVPTVWAPGVDISAAKFDPSGNYNSKTTGELHQSLSGTSMATPHVAGVAALLVEAARREGFALTPAQAQEILRDSSTPLTGENPFARTGGGEIDPTRALALLRQRYGKQPKTPDPVPSPKL